jgi:hypothetical protein
VEPAVKLINKPIRKRNKFMFNVKSHVQHRVDVRKKIPFRVQLAIAANSGLKTKNAMKGIHERERILQQKLNKESRDVERAAKSDNKERKLKEMADLVGVFSDIGVASYAYNFPNQKTLRLATRKSRKGTGISSLANNVRYSGHLRQDQKLKDKIARAEQQLKNFDASANKKFTTFVKNNEDVMQRYVEPLTKKILLKRIEDAKYKLGQLKVDRNDRFRGMPL